MQCTRRKFMRTTVLGMAALALPSCASLAAVRVPRSSGDVRLDLDAHPRLAESNGILKILPDGFTTPVYVVAVEGGFLALSAVCQHLGCTVGAQGDRFVCPCHGSTYARDGRVLRGPTERPLVQFPVVRSGRELVIRVGTGG